ncbi:MAG: phosphoribosylglycinamide formyltransferase [Flavobacteriales bacterium]|nr:phosphoribosylglycinamide formyltransferase [Flavobacteriales bacterium]
MKNIAILASGSGTNAEAIVKHLIDHSTLNVSVIATNKADAFVLERAKKLGIASIVFNKETLNSGAFLAELSNIDYIVLAGFLLKIPQNLINAYPQKIINIHPALLPNYGGKGMYGDRVHHAVIDNKDSESGITIHYVNENFDEGEIIFQAKCAISENDTPDDLATKIHKLEHTYYPKTIEQLWG